MIFIDFIYNLALLVSLSIVSGFVDKRFSRHTKSGLIIQGLLFGAVSIIGMIHPIVFSEGIIFDGRSVVLSLVALFFGPVSGVIAGVMAFAFRLYQGGLGVLPGTLVIFFSVLIGTIYHEYKKVVNKKITIVQLLFFGVIVHIVMLLTMFSLPFPTAVSILQQIGIPIILLFPFATVLIGKILSDQQVSSEALGNINESEGKLLEERYLMNALMDNIPDHIYFKDKDSRFTRISKEQALSYGINDTSLVLGKTDFDFFNEEHAREAFEDEMKIIRTGKPIVNIEENEILPNGEEKWVSTTKMPLRDKDGNIIGTFGISRDITDRKIAEESLRLSENFLKETQRIAELGSYALDIKTGTWTSSEIMDSIFGIEPDYDKSVKGWVAIIHPEWQKLMSDYLTNEVIALGKNFDKMYKIIRKKDNAERWVHGVGKLVFNENNEPIQMLGTIRDITERKVVEEELRKNRDELQDYFENDISADYVATPEGKIIDCNKTFMNMFGITDKNQLNNINIINYYKDPASREILIEEIKKNKRVSNYEAEFVLPSDKILNAILMLVGVFNDSGKLEKIRGYLVDITEKKRAEEGFRKLSLAVEQSPVSVIITSRTGEIEYVNEKFCEVTGYSREEVIGENPRILKSDLQDKEFYKQLWDTILAGNVWTGELLNKKKNGELYWESALISPMVNNNGEVTSFVAVKEDITERKREQEELIKAKEKAEEMSKLKSNFLSNMSHELRTPLIGILGYAEFLAGELKDKDLVEMANIIKNSGRRLNQTLNNILDISKIESDKQKVDIKQLDLLKLIDEQIKLFKPVAENKKLGLKLETNEKRLEAYVDEELFVSVINNLLSNAIKYTVKGSITVIARKETEKIVVEVEDTGIGIAEEYKEVIFEPFRQASEGLNRKFEGTGLGLALVKKYMSLIGGTISLKSEPNEGSTFTLEFLVNEPANEKVISTKW